jgi:predicted nucleic acid-binding protein
VSRLLAEILKDRMLEKDDYEMATLIVAAAKATACRYLLSEDLEAGQDLDGVTVVNPFLNRPNALSSQTWQYPRGASAV